MFKKDRSAIIVRLARILLCLTLGVFVTSCSVFAFEKVTMVPLAIPGAEYVGSDTCIACHENEYKYFQLSEHASVTIALSEEEQEEGDQAEGCETCHGPGSLHVEARGYTNNIIRADAETACFTCHLDIKAKFMLQHHHPVLEGKMFCNDCHDMHGSDVRATGGAMLLSTGSPMVLRQDEKCFKCHSDLRGPYVFEHEAMREGCVICHNPHGSISDKLLVAGQTITCIRCHIEDRHGQVHHHYACIDCHTKVHGSNNARSSLRY